jgi:hypothetical protein
MKNNYFFPIKKNLSLILLYVFFIIISIVLIQVESQKVKRNSERVLKDYPMVSIRDSINSKIVKINFPEGIKVYPEIRQVELFNGDQWTIFAKTTKDNISLGNILEVGSHIFKGPDLDSIIIQNFLETDTLTYRLKLLY